MTSELVAAFLWAQMEEAENITGRRLQIWDTYHAGFEQLENDEKLRRPIVPKPCIQNAHMYYLLLPDMRLRDSLIIKLAEAKIQAVFHYVPLHSSIYGARLRGTGRSLPFTENLSERLVRIPLWLGVENVQKQIIDVIAEAS
jgi:dTDP-4-amino-4,6-dideoxygalactose transaminase